MSELAVHTTTYTQEQVDLIKRTICNGATNDELSLFIQQSKRTGLDPFARQIHAVFRSTKENGQWVKKMSIQTGIDGFRLVAERTGKYAGQCGPYWCGEDGVWKDAWLDSKPPAAAKVGVYREGFKEPLYRTARYASYVQTKDGSPIRMWQQMPDVMIAKCAEAQALRAAFPQELSGLYTAEEMGQADNEPEIKHTANGTHKAEPKPAALTAATPAKPTLASMIEKWTAHDFKGDGKSFGAWVTRTIAALPEVATIPDDQEDLTEYVRKCAGVGDLQEWHDLTGEQLIPAKVAVVEWLEQLNPKG